MFQTQQPLPLHNSLSSHSATGSVLVFDAGFVVSFWPAKANPAKRRERELPQHTGSLERISLRPSGLRRCFALMAPASADAGRAGRQTEATGGPEGTL